LPSSLSLSTFSPRKRSNIFLVMALYKRLLFKNDLEKVIAYCYKCMYILYVAQADSTSHFWRARASLLAATICSVSSNTLTDTEK
jgi:hypothetical protein